MTVVPGTTASDVTGEEAATGDEGAAFVVDDTTAAGVITVLALGDGAEPTVSGAEADDADPMGEIGISKFS